MSDLYELGRPLGRRGLFQLVSDEAFRDGKLDPWENEILGALAGFLKLDANLARTIARMSKEKYKAGKFVESRPLDPVRLFREILRHAYSDADLDEKERTMLAGMQKLLKLSNDDRAKLESEVKGGGEVAAKPPPGVSRDRVMAAGSAASKLAREGKWKEAEATWKALFEEGPIEEDAASSLALEFTALVGERASGPLELVPGVVTLAERLAKADPPDPIRWVALGSAGHAAVRALAEDQRFGLVPKVMRALEGIPHDAGEAQGHHAEALASWGILAMKHGQRDEVLKATAAMEALAPHALVPEVVRARATLHSCALEWWCGHVKEPDPASAAFEVLHQLVNEHGDDRAVANSFAVCSEFALMLVLILRDYERVALHLERARMVSGAHPGDEEIQFALARAMVNTAIHVNALREDAPTRARLMGDVERTLAMLAASCPGSEKIEDAKGRLERVKLQNPQFAHASQGAHAATATPPAAARAAPSSPVPEDVRTMRAIFDAMQEGRTPPAPAFAILEIVGTGGYPRRVKEEGERVYAADEPYFLHLLAEVERQLGSDRIGFWQMQGQIIELVTRYMIEDATPAIADAARRVRRVAGFEDA
jgi:hypothetical protein